jgi:flagellar hook-associated protein 2
LATGVINVGGLATGLDTNKIIDQLVALEQRPVLLLQQEQTDVQSTRTSVATVNTKLATLKTASDALDTAVGVLVRKATSSDETVATAAAGSGAQRGSLTISVTRLASGSVAGGTVGVSSATHTVAAGTGTFQFQVGSGDVQSVAIDATTTLQDLAGAINDLGAGVTASAVNLGTSSSPDWRLELVSGQTGQDSTITVVHDDTSLAVQTTQAGLDASFTASGFSGTFTRSSNTFSDVLTGVTIQLKNQGNTTITVDDDADAITDQVKTLVNAFNDLVAFVGKESNVTEAQDKSNVDIGSLATDSTVKRVLSRLHEVFSESVGGTYTNLSSVGLATQQDGTITLDEAKLRAAIAADPNAVAATFAGDGTTKGVADDLSSFVGDVTGTGGAIPIHDKGLDDQLSALQDQIDVRQRAVNAFEQQVRLQFAALESLVSGLQTQGSLLTRALG